VEGSALDLPFADAAFEVVLCQLGLQFFPDRAAALREMRRVLAAGGRIGVTVFAAIEHNPATHALSDALDRRLGQGASRAKRNEHSIPDVEQLRALLREAGFADVRIETATRTVSFPSAAEYVRIQFAATPVAALLADRDPAERERVVGLVTGDVRARLATFEREGALAFPQEVHVAQATA
jgi:SAM-dependent methyltransferase